MPWHGRVVSDSTNGGKERAMVCFLVRPLCGLHCITCNISAGLQYRDYDMGYVTVAWTVRLCLRSVAQTSGYCWPTPKCRNWCVQHAFFEGKKVEETSPRKSTARTLKPGRLRARSCRPFLPAPHRTGLDTCRIIRLSGFLVSLTLAYGNGCRHDIVCRAECSCVFGIS